MSLWTIALMLAGLSPDHLQKLSSAQIRDSLIGNMISYGPPGWADAGMNEEFYPDGQWAGTRLGRGPIGMSGDWSIAGNEICVTHTIDERPRGASDPRMCRAVWRDPVSNELWIDYLARPDWGLQKLVVRPAIGSMQPRSKRDR